MNSALTSTVVFACLVGAVLLGRGLRRHVPEQHLTGDSKDAVKLAMGLVATMTALLLGLLVSSAKDTYDAQRGKVIEMAAKIAFMDRVFALYGPDAAEVRAQFRAAVEDVVHRMWPKESNLPPQLSPNVAAGDPLYAALQGLSPQDELHRSLKAQLISLGTELGQLHLLLLAQSVPSLAKSMLIAVVCWLLVIYLSQPMQKALKRITPDASQ